MIHVDELEIASSSKGESVTWRTLSKAEAEATGWFSGPPYATAKVVFDEYDLEACEPA